ncbi:MAG TPA: alanine racemase [Polyangiaceae bacterium]|nr:alanine racemase [Polyangiaceae bacterium]
MTSRNPALSALAPAVATPLPRVLRPQRAVPADAVRPTRAEVNLAHLRHNLRVVQRLAGGRPVWAVLKADGYGHGSKAVARTLERAGAAGMCVALLEEGVELRDAGIKIPILVTGGYYGRAWGELLRHDLTPVLHDLGQVEALADEVRYSSSEPIRVHVKVDTGMSRLGMSNADLPRLAEALARHPEVRLDGLMTHFACADAGETPSIDAQLDRFDEATAALARLGVEPRLRHAANSAALMRSERSWLDLVRPGIALFGVEPKAGLCRELRPVMRVRTEIIALRELPVGATAGYGGTWVAERPSRIATVPIGYADGLVRALSNQGSLLVRGRRAPIAGAVSMDMTMLDVTDVEGVRLGDECVVLGTQKGPLGEDTILASEVAADLGTIPWEVMTNISRRVPRFYREP